MKLLFTLFAASVNCLRHVVLYHMEANVEGKDCRGVYGKVYVCLEESKDFSKALFHKELEGQVYRLEYEGSADQRYGWKREISNQFSIIYEHDELILVDAPEIETFPKDTFVIALHEDTVVGQETFQVPDLSFSPETQRLIMKINATSIKQDIEIITGEIEKRGMFEKNEVDEENDFHIGQIDTEDRDLFKTRHSKTAKIGAIAEYFRKRLESHGFTVMFHFFKDKHGPNIIAYPTC